MAPVCITRQLAMESAHTIRRITRDIVLPREKKRSAIRCFQRGGPPRGDGRLRTKNNEIDPKLTLSQPMHMHFWEGHSK